jgi:hypothetical protein
MTGAASSRLRWRSELDVRERGELDVREIEG